MKFKKVVLLYSGGLDTSVMLKWIQEKYSCELIALTLDIGQPQTDFEKTKAKALKLGAKKAFVIDAKKEFAEEYVSKAIKANAMYEDSYPLSTAIGRPLLAKWAVKIAEQEGADAIAHGSTGKGNDQVRIEATVSSLNPNLTSLAPVREWGLTREEEMAYAEKHGIPIPEKSVYSTDENMWGKSTECGVLEDPFHEPPEEVFSYTTLPEKAPAEAELIEIEFQAGIPCALNGVKMPLHELVMKLNGIAAKHGVGVSDHMEDRIVGLKSREVYECPAAECILKAHKDLEKTVCTIHENTFKTMVDDKWAYMAYAGLWLDPLMGGLNAFIDKTNEKVCGKVKLKLFKGSAKVVGRSSPYALYDLNLSTYEKGSLFNQNAAPGFIELWGLQSKLANHISAKNGAHK